MRGLQEVTNPSELFLGDRDDTSPGTAVFAGVEGTRPILVEIQALIAPSPFAAPRRAVVGWDANRLSMILAVLDARCGFKLGNNDIYLNVAGGLRISEPAADVAVAAALFSAHSGIALGRDSVYFGEASLSGAIRPVSHAAMRLKEAQKLGFTAAVGSGLWGGFGVFVWHAGHAAQSICPIWRPASCSDDRSGAKPQAAGDEAEKR